MSDVTKINGYAIKDATARNGLANKQDAIFDLSDIRSGAALGATAVQPETGKGLFSGSYNDLTDQPTIPAEVTESTVSGWGFTKNTGTYSKPDDGIPAEDLAQDVQNGIAQSVKYNPQTLTDSQKAQARQNINAAAPDGYYGDSGGVYQYSTNFIGKNTPQNARDIVFRPTASPFSGQSWSADSISRQTAAIEKIKGKTVVWNQLVQNGNFANGTTWWSPSRGSISASEHILTYVATEIGTSFVHNRVFLLSAVPILSNHVYFMSMTVKSPFPNAAFGIAGNWRGAVPVTPGVFSTASAIITVTQPDGVAMNYGVDMQNGRVGDTFQLKNCICIDLTQMFGAGNEPSTPEELRAMFPLDYYEYNPGELISLNAAGLKTVGFNQLYPDDHIDVLKGLTYRIEGAYTSLKDSAGNDVAVTNNEFTPTANNTYTMTGGSCVHLKWSGVRDGETEPHWDSTLALPVSTYFPDGMKSAGSVYDELTKDKAIKRIGKVDLGTLDWRKETVSVSSIGYRFVVYGFTGVKIAAAQDDIFNGICAGYTPTSPKGTYLGSQNKTFSNNISAPAVYFCDEDFSDAASFKAAMAGVYLYYELADPVETPISPELGLTYRCDDFGTEMLLPQNDDELVTAPMDADITYQIDYEAQVRNNGRLNISKASMDAFIAAFNASGLGTITQTWDAANKRYAYTVTAPAPDEGGETI